MRHALSVQVRLHDATSHNLRHQYWQQCLQVACLINTVVTADHVLHSSIVETQIRSHREAWAYRETCKDPKVAQQREDGIHAVPVVKTLAVKTLLLPSACALHVCCCVI
jgi:hypothetical protein